MKRSISIICLVLLAFSLFSSSYAFAVENGSDNSKLPGFEISEKKHFNSLTKMKDMSEIKNYLDNLDKKELLTAVAECSEELEKSNAFYEMQIFTEYIDKKLGEYLNEDDYISIIENQNYSIPFKIFMIDTHFHFNDKYNKKNSEKYNNILIDIVTNDNQRSDLRSYALNNIDDYSNLKVDVLKNLLKNKNSEDFLKKSALCVINRIDKSESYKLTKDIVKHLEAYSNLEVNTAMKLLLRTPQEVVDYADGMDTRIEDIENVIKKTKDNDVRIGAVIALADTNNIIGARTVIDNRLIINDDSLIKYYIDKNYKTVQSMLDANNSLEVIEAGLTCIEIAPFRSFLPILEKLYESENQMSIKSRIEILIDKVKNSPLDRNKKWDDR